MKPDQRDKGLSSGLGGTDFVAGSVTESPCASHSPAHAPALLLNNKDILLLRLPWEVFRVCGGAHLP